MVQRVRSTRLVSKTKGKGERGMDQDDQAEDVRRHRGSKSARNHPQGAEYSHLPIYRTAKNSAMLWKMEIRRGLCSGRSHLARWRTSSILSDGGIRSSTASSLARMMLRSLWAKLVIVAYLEPVETLVLVEGAENSGVNAYWVNA